MKNSPYIHRLARTRQDEKFSFKNFDFFPTLITTLMCVIMIAKQTFFSMLLFVLY